MLDLQIRTSPDPVVRASGGGRSTLAPRQFGSPVGIDAARRATEFIMGRLDEPLSVRRIASASGLSVRTLHRVILREHGVSPMVLLRRVRLAKARHQLQAPCSATTVTMTALQWGFAHLGRFSRTYARQFGESPTLDTLRRAPAAGSAGCPGVSIRGASPAGPRLRRRRYTAFARTHPRFATVTRSASRA